MTGGDDVGQIKRQDRGAGQVSMKIGEAMYKAQQARGAAAASRGAGAGGGGGGGTAGDDKVVDADFEEVDEQKKRGPA